MGIGGVLSQEGHLITFFGGVFTYDKEYNAIVQSLRFWRFYLLPMEFVLFFYHQALRCLNSQKKLNTRHTRWVEFLNEYSSVINHRAGIENKVVDALS